MKSTISILVAVLVSGCVTAWTGEPGINRGGALTNDKGMTLYTFAKDVEGSGKSECAGQCAKNWPPLTASHFDTGRRDWAVIERSDGVRQWTHKGKPLYLWVKDQKPGDKTGEGVNGVWSVAKP